MEKTKDMIRCSRAAAIPASLALVVGCATMDEPMPSATTGAEVVFQVYEELGGPVSDPFVSCKVGYRYIYPPDLPVHAREIQIDVVGSPMLGSGGALELPRPERDPRPTLREDGLMVFDLTLASFGRCRRAGSDAGPVIEVSIGECSQGDCPPMRFEPVDGAELVEFRLIED